MVKGRPSKSGSTSQFPQSTNCPRRHPAGWSITTRVAITLRWSSAPPASHFTGLADRPAKPTRLFVGKFPEMGVETARKKTRRLSAARDEGRDPAAERKASRKEPTLAELWENYLELHAKPRKKSLEGRRTAVQQVPGTAPRQAPIGNHAGRCCQVAWHHCQGARPDSSEPMQGPAWRRCSPRHRPPWATPARIRP